MRNPLRVILSFPRLYLALYLFGREFNLDVGWFEADIQEDWAFGPELVLLRKLTCKGYGGGGKDGFVSYCSSLGFSAFQHHLSLELGMVKYND